jgi:hypothetical protein
VQGLDLEVMKEDVLVGLLVEVRSRDQFHGQEDPRRHALQLPVLEGHTVIVDKRLFPPRLCLLFRFLLLLCKFKLAFCWFTGTALGFVLLVEMLTRATRRLGDNGDNFRVAVHRKLESRQSLDHLRA